MTKLNLGNDLYIHGRIGWRGLSKDEYLDFSNYKIINATALMDGYVDWNNCGFISKERYMESEEIMLKENDILISKDGTLGKIGYVKNLTSFCTVASGIFVLRNTMPDVLNFDYLYHILKSNIFKDFIRRNKALGSTISHLYQRDLANFVIDLPDYETQTAIANVLNALDSKIENNDNVNDNLQQTIQTIYDYWFTQFDFPDENGNPYRSSGGAMVLNNDLKKAIPAGWETNSLLVIADFVNGLACQKYRPKKGESSLPVIKISEMHDGITDSTELVKSTIPEKYIINNGDILFSWSASLEVMRWYGGKGGLNQHIFRVNPIKYGYNYTYLQLLNYVIHFIRIAQSRKTTMGHITADHLKQSRIAIPPREIAEKFEKIVEPLFDAMKNLEMQNYNLKNLRNWLLPMLMNGQAAIKE